MSIAIRPIQTHAEYRAVEQLQREVWGLPDVEVVPTHLLLTAAKNGGLLLVAVDGDALVGFVFGFLGFTPAGKLKHCSHMAGVHPDYRDQGLGYQLKLAQRAHVLAQGIDLITWTFDPLQTRNAHLNFHKLGAVCQTYIRNLYGEMRDELNAGLPSDRLQVDWWISSERVTSRLRVEDVHLASARRSPQQAGTRESPTLIAVPANFQALKAADMALAAHWRMRTRQQFEEAFAQGLQVVDITRQGDLCYYELERSDPDRR